MHTLLWILCVVYAVSALMFAARLVKKENVRYGRRTRANLWDLGTHVEWSPNLEIFGRFRTFYPLHLPTLVVSFILFATIGFPLWLAYWPSRTWHARQELLRKQREAEEKKAREERIRKWKEENPPVIYFNTINGVTVAVRKDQHDRAVEKRDKDVRNGLAQKRKILPPIYYSFLFYHASAKNAPELFKTGWLSDFDDLKKVARVERRSDIFVPFVSEGLVTLVELEGGSVILMPNEILSLQGRIEEARRHLLQVHVPPEISDPK